MTDKIILQEALVVEGRDDEDAVLKACEALVIKTHGFGIRRETWDLIGKAYREKGIIILTDPDFSGEEIRRKITERFPNAKQAYLPLAEALKDDDIGVENATPEAIREALLKVRERATEGAFGNVTLQDLDKLGLSGRADSSFLREQVSAALGIGYGNTKKFLKKVNAFGIGVEELAEAVRQIEQKQ